MLFNSYGFIFIYLPLVLLVFFLVGRAHHRLATGWLAIASILFYAYWNPTFVGLLLASVGANFVFGICLIKTSLANRWPRRCLLGAAIAVNLLTLAYYKYANFIIDNLNLASGRHFALHSIILPLGISFFTFTQLAFLVDAYQGKIRAYNFVDYVLFVTYFPHLIAGPILHHQEMMPQFRNKGAYNFNFDNFAVGITIFAIGLFKKVALADSLVQFVGPVFAPSGSPGSADAWAGAIGYTLQIYFDFSGYSDMAIGVSRMFGIRLPLNFNSPYKARSIIEFWRRWHMTLSRFLRDYLYIPLGGNRQGKHRRYFNLLLTMLLGGLWHGAAWTYVLWGFLHGLYLLINHWFSSKGLFASQTGFRGPFWRLASWLLTFACVVIAWVIFRAESLRSASKILGSMAFLHGSGNSQVDWRLWIPLAGFGLLVVWVLPNTHELMRNHQPDLADDLKEDPRARAYPTWRPNILWLGLTFVAFALSLALVTSDSPFIYFQF